MITDTSLTPERVKARFSLTFRPKPERIGDESLILKVPCLFSQHLVVNAPGRR